MIDAISAVAQNVSALFSRLKAVESIQAATCTPCQPGSYVLFMLHYMWRQCGGSHRRVG